ncbi:hypothetical protein D3C85_925370 [compost metagenome]
MVGLHTAVELVAPVGLPAQTIAVGGDVGAVQIGVDLAVAVGIRAAVDLGIGRLQAVDRVDLPTGRGLDAVDLGTLAAHLVEAADVLQARAQLGVGFEVADFGIEGAMVEAQADLAVIGDDRLQVEEAVDAQARLTDAAQHPADVRHAEAFRVVGEYLRPVSGLEHQAGVEQGFLERRAAALDADAAGGSGGRGDGMEIVDVQSGEFVAHAGVQGQALGGLDFGLEEGREVAKAGFRHPLAVGFDQHLAGGVLQYVEAAGEPQQAVEHTLTAEAELAAVLVRLVL